MRKQLLTRLALFASLLTGFVSACLGPNFSDSCLKLSNFFFFVTVALALASAAVYLTSRFIVKNEETSKKLNRSSKILLLFALITFIAMPLLGVEPISSSLRGSEPLSSGCKPKPASCIINPLSHDCVSSNSIELTLAIILLLGGILYIAARFIKNERISKKTRHLSVILLICVLIGIVLLFFFEYSAIGNLWLENFNNSLNPTGTGLLC
ncbi:Uncharacterised protein [Candidatus Gugararchaeum adminiculabundum]|nr:Uncharacterised protein [Candidatus Gugararchaeum adminiculabundum]